MQQISDFDTHTFMNLTNHPVFQHKILQNCPRRIAADVRKMKVYNCTRSDLSRYRIDADISKLVKKRIWSQSLDLHLSNRENINLARALPYLKKLTFLSVDFSSELGANPNIDSNILLLLSKILYCLKNLRTLRLNLKSCKKFPEKSIKSFASKLRKCSTLKKVALNIESSGGLDNSFLYLSHAISKLNYLEDFKINIDNFKISNHGLVTSLNSIATCTTLTQLCIGLHLSAKYDVTTHVAKSLSKMKQLTKLKLDFSFCLDIEDKGIIALSKSLVNLTNLNRLELSFQRCLKVTDKGVIVLGESIKDLSKLKQLRLLLLNCSGVTDSSIKVVAQNVILLPELYQFHFGFGHWPNVSDVCFSEVLAHLSTASQLKDLRIAFEAQSPQSEGGLITIGENLVNYKNLVKLSVKFISRFITDKGLQIFAQNIEHMKQLTHLKLNFNGKSRITDNGIKFLSQGLGHLPHLSVFEITLIQPKSFSEPGLVALMQGLGRYNQELTSLRIICHFCEGIDDNALLSLGERLFKISSLRFLKLIFFACSNITDVGLEGLSRSITQNLHHIQAYLDCILCPKLSEKGNLILREFKDK